MTCQNTTQSPGGGGNSTIVEYAGDGSVINTRSLPDKADGIGGDPLNHRLIVTLNEDAHTTWPRWPERRTPRATRSPIRS